MTLKNVLKFFSKTNSEDLGAKGSFAITQDDEESVIQRAKPEESYGKGLVIQRVKPEESHGEEVLRFAQDDGTDIINVTLNLFQGLIAAKTRHFDKMLKQVQHDNFSCAKHTVKHLSSNRLNVLTTLKKCAFTLAEVLITLGIIGVVAAMTLPTLIQNHQKQTYVTGLKKAYANLQNAFAKMAYDEGVTDWSQTYCANAALQDCSGIDVILIKDKREICLESLKKQINVVSYSVNENAFFKTVDGMIYTPAFGVRDSIEYNSILTLVLSYVYVDVNGDKGPNKWGRDKFVFFINYEKNRIQPDGFRYGHYQYCTTTNLSGVCTAKVLIEGKMDY